MSLKIIQDAITQRRTIIFEYNKPEKVRGKRIGNPHAAFVMHLKDGSKVNESSYFPNWRS